MTATTSCWWTYLMSSIPVYPWLRRQDYQINPKRIRRLMRLMGIEAIYPKPQLKKTPIGGYKVSISAERINHWPSQSGMVCRHYVYQDAPRLCLSSGHHGLFQKHVHFCPSIFTFTTRRGSMRLLDIKVYYDKERNMSMKIRHLSVKN